MPFTQSRRASSSTIVLAIILACYLMIVLDVSVIITALPKIHGALHFSSTGLSWVQNAYTLTFGGLLLLGARAGDIFGRRRVFMAGITLFTAASFAGGLAQSASWLLAARAVQGVGAAIAAPSTLALLLISFREGTERVRALSYYAAVAGGGGSVGLVLGGMLTEWISWRWGLFLNVPIGIALVTLAPRYLPETEREPRQFDLTGAATSTLGMTALIYGFVRAADDGWGNPGTLGAFAASVVLLTAFVLTELRAEQPITPMRLFVSRERSGAYVARILIVGGIYAMFFFMTQFLQGVRHYTPLEAGLAFLPMTLLVFSMVQTVPRIAARIGDTRLLIGGLSLALVGMAWLSRVSAGSPYVLDIAVPLAITGVGMGLTLGPLTGAGIAGVDREDAGAASGLVNAAHQLGGSLGIAVLVTVFAAAARHAAHDPAAGASASAQAAHQLAHAVSAALTGSAVALALGLAVVVLVVRRPAARTEVAGAEAAPVR